jgi:hypothetical protein
LREGDPAIWVRAEGDDLFVAVHLLDDGEVQIVADRLHQILSS